MKTMLFSAFLLITISGLSQSDTAIVTFKNPSSVMTPKGYSHAAIIDLGNCKMIIMSGQVALDSKGNLVGKDDMAKQTEQIFINIKNIISAAGGNMNNVIKLGIYMSDIKQIQAVRNVRDKFINIKNPPASTLVEVSRLFRDDIMIEIEATAIIQKK